MKAAVGSFFLVGFQLFVAAQEVVPFSVRYQSEISGEMLLISNQIINRKSASKSFDDRGVNTKHNDEFFMEYIDVDQDPSTFSSSSAELKLSKQGDYKLVFAGLYWAATYPYQQGRLKNKKFVVDDTQRAAINQVKLKMPDRDTYEIITGQIIYDAALTQQFSSSKPYAVFADITDLVGSLTDYSGVYTVANIRATQGTISGGVSAGWSLVFIFENPELPHRFFSVYDGFVAPQRHPIDITFSGFDQLPEGNVSASLVGAALEGDLNIKGDRLYFKTDTSEEFMPLYNSLRNEDNFFNSAITVDDSHDTRRHPNHLNTLGYDAFSLQLNAENQLLLNEPMTQGVLRLQSYSDRLFFFMCGFSLEVLPQNEKYAESEEISQKANSQLEDLSPIVAIREKSAEERFEVEEVEVEPPIQESKINTTTSARSPYKLPSWIIPSMTSGFYLVAHVFSIPENATSFITYLETQGFKPGYFVNPKNGYYYVFIAGYPDLTTAQKALNSKFNGLYTDEMWILEIKNP